MKITFLTTLYLICMGSVYAQSQLDNFFIRKMKKADRIGMQVAYIAEGELQWAGSYGLKEYQTTEKVNDSTLFMIASTSKPVTALALMKLYDEGKVSLDEEVNKFLPFTLANPNFLPSATIGMYSKLITRLTMVEILP